MQRHIWQQTSRRNASMVPASSAVCRSRSRTLRSISRTYDDDVADRGGVSTCTFVQKRATTDEPWNGVRPGMHGIQEDAETKTEMPPSFGLRLSVHPRSTHVGGKCAYECDNEVDVEVCKAIVELSRLLWRTAALCTADDFLASISSWSTLASALARAAEL